MKKKTIKIVIFCKDKEIAEKFRIAMEEESKYFKEEIITVKEMAELNKIRDIKLLIYIINSNGQNELKKYKYEDLEEKSDKIIIIDKENEILQNNDGIRSIKKYDDDRAIAFSILYNYYLEFKEEI